MLPYTALGHAPAEAPASAQCNQPTRPAENVPPAQWNAFLDAVDAFRDCTHRAMERHQHAAAVHQTAAKAAVDEWNLFVRHSLNAPKDFPHETSQTRSRSRNPAGVAEVNGGYSGANPQGELRPQFNIDSATTGFEQRGDYANHRDE
ncbi:MAG: hypothetical protein AB8B93_02545 [Pseudomonadales bacterium]